MNRCTRCWMPDTRPNSVFIDGVCGACRNYDKRTDVNWPARWDELVQVCRDAQTAESNSHYDCLIAVSGGKDSYTLVKVMVEDMRMHPLLVTVADPFTRTKAGEHNLRNLCEKYPHWTHAISPDLFRRATRAAFEDAGEPLKYIEYAIYTVPYILAQKFRIPLVIFGENSAYEYGSVEKDFCDVDIGAVVKKIDTEAEWWRKMGVSRGELAEITPDLQRYRPRIIYMSYFKPWSSVEHLKIAQERGFKTLKGEWDRKGTCENFEQIDSVAYMVHLWMKYPKFGFQRAADIASRRVREGLMSLDEAKEVMETVDPVLDPRALKDFCKTLGYTEKEFWEIARKWDKAGVLK